jgi:hypothetical protein
MNINAPCEDQIQARAHEVYLERGGRPGHEMDDRVPAGFELTHPLFRMAHLAPLKARRGFLRRRRGRLFRALP